MPPVPKIYKATEIAASLIPVKPLAGNHRSAQAYVDRIVASDFWQQNCPPSWMGVTTEYRSDDKLAVPSKIMVRDAGKGEGGYVLADGLFNFGERFLPVLWIGTGHVSRNIPAISDQWVILHELAHVWDAESPGHHAKTFTRAFLGLVEFRLGSEHARILRGVLRGSRI